MSNKLTIINKDVHETFLNLIKSSKKLNESSDTLTKEILIVENAINKLNLGVHAEIDTNNPNIKVAYGRHNKKWGILIIQVDVKEVWLFSDAPRAYRITASHYIIELIEALAKVAQATTDRLYEATLKAKAYLEGMTNEV